MLVIDKEQDCVNAVYDLTEVKISSPMTKVIWTGHAVFCGVEIPGYQIQSIHPVLSPAIWHEESTLRPTLLKMRSRTGWYPNLFLRDFVISTLTFEQLDMSPEEA